MMNLAPLIDFLLLVALLAFPIALLVWFVRGSDSPAGGLFGMRSDASSPPVPEEVDPPRWRIELIGQGTVTSDRSTEARVERPAFSGKSADRAAIVRACPRRITQPTFTGSG
jgi:hypothetical protein